MANNTDFLNLLLPGFREYRDAWAAPLNSNFTILDSWAEGINQEVVDARFSKTTIKAFLEVGHQNDGTLKATPEMIAARNSPVYGYQTPEPANYLLNQRINQVDWEVWKAREGQDNVKALSAFRKDGFKSMVLSGSKDADGYPTWMGHTGADLQIDGSTTPIWFSVDGKLARIRTLRTLALSGSAGTKYIWIKALAEDSENNIVVDGRKVSPDTPNGTTSLDLGGIPVYFNDSTLNFTNENVEARDYLTLEDSDDKGNYVVQEVAPGGTTTQLLIIGQFPVGGLSSINYTIRDLLRVEIGFDDAIVEEADKFYIGEAYFDGASIVDFPSETVAVRPRHFGDTFIGEWIAVDVTVGNGVPNLGTLVPGKFETKYMHNLGSDILDVEVQSSQANDGSAVVEAMTLATFEYSLDVSLDSSGLTINKNDTLVFGEGALPSFTQGVDTFNPGGSGASFAQGSDAWDPGSLPSLSGSIDSTLSGNVTGSLTGSANLENSVKVKWDKNYIWLKNTVIDKFYTDYDGSVKQTGYVRVIVRKRG